MSSAFTNSLINGTNPNPYEQILVLSQKMINDAFYNMWVIADDDTPLHRFETSTRGGDTIDVEELGAPSVQLQVTTVDPQLYFLLPLTSGSMKLYTSSDPTDDTHVDIDIEDWVCAFSVKISRKIIQKSDPEYQEFMDKTGLPEGNFSLAQLYIDSSSSTSWSRDLSSFGDYDYDSLTAEAQTAFEAFIDTSWLKTMSKKGYNIVGYSAQANDSSVNTYAPTFPPTSIDYYVYPWKDPSQQDPTVTDDLDENALTYLMMSNFKNPPSPVGLPYSGTFVQEGGRYCMNRDNFWDLWLLPLMQVLNQGSEVVPTTPPLAYDASNADHPWATYIAFTIGGNPDHTKSSDSYFAFNPDASDQTTWTWTGDRLEKSNSITNSDDNWEKVDQTSVNGTTLKYDAGNETVSLTGKNVFTFKVTKDHDKWSTVIITSTWEFKMTLQGVDDGGVEFAHISDDDPCDSEYTDDGNLSWTASLDDVAAEFSNDLNTYLTSGVTDVENNLLGALENQNKLFLPAAGTFLMKDPLFNKRGDLMVSLAYNGDDPPTTTTTANAVTAAVKAVKTSLQLNRPPRTPKK